MNRSLFFIVYICFVSCVLDKKEKNFYASEKQDVIGCSSAMPIQVTMGN